MKIYVTGDTHGELDFEKIANFRDILKDELTMNDYLIVCGDFGFIWDGGERDDRMIEKYFKDFPCTLLWVDGNHENFEALYKYPIENWNGGKIHRISPGIIHLMRGEIFTLGKSNERQCKIFAFGGAKSIDRGYDLSHIDWWPEELPSQAEMLHGLENLAAHNNKVDLIITHDCPLQQYREMFKFEWEFTSHINTYFDEIANGTDFKYWFFGHYHEDKRHGKYHVLCDRIVKITFK